MRRKVIADFKPPAPKCWNLYHYTSVFLLLFFLFSNIFFVFIHHPSITLVRISSTTSFHTSLFFTTDASLSIGIPVSCEMTLWYINFCKSTVRDGLQMKREEITSPSAVTCIYPVFIKQVVTPTMYHVLNHA